jgi:hypothetical protein
MKESHDDFNSETVLIEVRNGYLFTVLEISVYGWLVHWFGPVMRQNMIVGILW